MEKKLKDIRITKEFRHIKFDEKGNRYNEFVECDVPLVRNFYLYGLNRAAAKIIDFAPVFFLLLIIFKNFSILKNYQIFLIALVINIFYGTISEWKFGKTFGKQLLKLNVIDEYGKTPNLQKAFTRNLTAILNLTLFAYEYIPPPNSPFVSGIRLQFCMNINNWFSKTHIIDNKNLKYINAELEKISNK